MATKKKIESVRTPAQPDAPAKSAPRRKATAKPGAATGAATRDKAEPSGWRRAESDHSVTQELGERIRSVRESRGLSLAQLSAKCGIPGASLSRIENNKMSPTFGMLARVMMGLEADWADLTGPKPADPNARLISFAERGEGKTSKVRTSTATVLHPHDSALFLPIRIDVRARDLEEAGGLVGHRGEEFCYVLSGKLLFHMEGMAPRLMTAGASALFDSATPHAYLAGSASGAVILLVVNRNAGSRPDGAPLA